MASKRYITNDTTGNSATISHDGEQFKVIRATNYMTPAPTHYCTSWKEASFIADLFVNSKR